METQQQQTTVEAQGHASEMGEMTGGLGGAIQARFHDNRPEAVQMRNMQFRANQSPQVSQLKTIQRQADQANTRDTARQSQGLLQCKLGGGAVIQRILHIDGGEIGQFSDIEVYVQDLEALRGGIVDAVGREVSPLELDNAVRSINLDLPAGPENMDTNQAALLDQLPAEIIASHANEGTAQGGMQLPPALSADLAQLLGGNEAQRLTPLIQRIHATGFVSTSQIAAIFHNSALANSHSEGLNALLVELADDPLATKMLLQQSPGDILKIVSRPEDKLAFTQQVTTFRNGAAANELDPMLMVDMGNDQRYGPVVAGVSGLVRDFQIVAGDMDFNIQADLGYISQLETNLAQTPSGPDQDKLTAEIARMKKIYAHKVNYLSIIRDRADHFAQLEATFQDLQTELETSCQTDVAGLQEQHDAVVTPTFRPRATDGYRMRKTRDAENERSAFKRQMVQRQDQCDAGIKSAQSRMNKDKQAFLAQAADFLEINKKYMHFLESGIMMLPGDMRMAGIFPNSESVHIGADQEEGHHHVLAAHARKLIAENGLYQGKLNGLRGMLPGARTGCVCIMFVKEGDINSEQGATFRPIFGASGVSPYGENQGGVDEQEMEDQSYVNMGLPTPDREDLSHESAAGNLGQHVADMERLGIKTPSMQSKLYFMQTPEYEANKVKKQVQAGDGQEIPEEIVQSAEENTTGMLESWMPSNCAEPAIMTAIYQMYHAPTDIYLSVPFEGVISKSGELLLKYTCTRCAVSEPAFMSPMQDGQEELTNMQVYYGHDHEHEHEHDHDHNHHEHGAHEHILRAGLVYNNDNPHHPYADKSAAIRETMIKNADAGFTHIGALQGGGGNGLEQAQALDQAVQEVVNQLDGADDAAS